MNQPMLKADHITKCLSRNGFSIVRQKGSHVRMRHNDGRVTSVPSHSGQDIGKGLLKKILRDTELTMEELLLNKNWWRIWMFQTKRNMILKTPWKWFSAAHPQTWDINQAQKRLKYPMIRFTAKSPFSPSLLPYSTPWFMRSATILSTTFEEKGF